VVDCPGWGTPRPDRQTLCLLTFVWEGPRTLFHTSEGWRRRWLVSGLGMCG
jgi:hypothetical protein